VDACGPGEELHRRPGGIAGDSDAFGRVTVNLAYWIVDHLRYRFTLDYQAKQ
jgi:hypothetical protein